MTTTQTNATCHTDFLTKSNYESKSNSAKLQVEFRKVFIALPVSFLAGMLMGVSIVMIFTK